MSIISVRSAGSLVAKLFAKTAKKAKAKLRADKKEVQEALQTTWVLNGIIKRAQLTYLYIGKLLNEVRQKKMWQAVILGTQAQHEIGLSWRFYSLVMILGAVIETESVQISNKPCPPEDAHYHLHHLA